MERSNSDPIKVIVISGPTGVGKSSLAVELALRFQGEIINADCMQVYRGFDVGTAKPSLEDRQKVPHHLFDILEPEEEFNAGRFQLLASKVIEEIWLRKRIPIVVGGTGLYIRALLKGLIDVPSEKRHTLREELNAKTTQELYEELQIIDTKASEKIHPNDRVRILRALEIYYLTQKPPTELWKMHNFGEKRYNALCIFLYMERSELYKVLEKRCDEMMSSGLVEEVKELLKKHLPQLKPFQSIGYRHIIKHILQNIPLMECVKEFKRDTKRYAKRQFIWFKKEPEFLWVPSAQKLHVFRLVEEFIKSGDNQWLF